MDSDESGHSESEFYYPEEETLNQIAPKNFFPKFKKKKRKKKTNKYVIYRARSVRMGKNCALGLEYSFFPIRTSRPVNNIYILFL